MEKLEKYVEVSDYFAIINEKLRCSHCVTLTIPIVFLTNGRYKKSLQGLHFGHFLAEEPLHYSIGGKGLVF